MMKTKIFMTNGFQSKKVFWLKNSPQINELLSHISVSVYHNNIRKFYADLDPRLNYDPMLQGLNL